MLRHVLKAVEAAPGLSLRRMWTISRWRRCLLSAAGYCSSIYCSIVVVVVWGAIWGGASRPSNIKIKNYWPYILDYIWSGVPPSNIERQMAPLV